MRRADRLFALLQALRGGRLRTAAQLAATLEVSSRTIYRDIEALVAQGVPIDGARGVGYLLREPIFLPPLALTRAELEALHLGTAMVAAHGDEALATAARELLIKVEAVLPSDRRALARTWPTTARVGNTARVNRRRLGIVRAAIVSRTKLRLVYEDADERISERVVRPLGLEYWGHAWTCTAWCEQRGDFRVFRVDRMSACEPAGETFQPEPGRTLAAYLAQLPRAELA